jgi:signal transduction histidine kinase/ActR/RegA family two-component response regulator
VDEVVFSARGVDWKRVVEGVVASGRPDDLVVEEGGRVWRYELWAISGTARAVEYVMAKAVEETEVRAKLRDLERYNRLGNVVPGMVYSFRLRPDGRASLPFCTGLLRELWGLDPEVLRDDFSKAFALIHPQDLPRVQESIAESAKTLQHWRCDFRVMHPEKGERWLEGNSLPQREVDGGVIWHGFVQDVTERKTLEAALRQTQKLEAVGQLAGGVAHDFNNLLASMMMQVDMLRMREDLDEELTEGLGELREEAQRAAALTRQLLMFSRRSVLELKPLNLNGAVEGALKMVGRVIGEHVRLRFESWPDLPLVVADLRMMEQVLVNLAVNSRDAMPKGGSIVIRTGEHVFEPVNNALHPLRRAGRFVCLEVRDNGCGMDEETRARVFEPFFSTKPSGKGTGLGLATVHGIAAQHHGWVELESAKDRGTVVRLFIPASEAGEAVKNPGGKDEFRRRGRGTILVVEDEESVRVALGRTLRSMGYTVLVAENGQRAMRVWQQHGEAVDLLITDMVMPEGMTGLELAEKLMALKPGLKVVISSGYSSEIAQAGVPTRTGIRYLPKPYDQSALGRTLEAVFAPER